MFKKTAFLLLVLAGLCVPHARAWWGDQPDITMLVVPAEKTAVRIAQDMASMRPVLIVTYRQSGDDLRINAWNGKSWVGVKPEDYVNGAFFATAPDHVIIIEAQGSPAPQTMIPAGSWCSRGNRLTSTEPRVLLHLLGRYFDLSYQNWKDLTWRYQLPLEEINPGLVNIPWWHFRANEIYQARMKRNLAADLEQWLFLDITPPDPVEPADMSGPLGDQPRQTAETENQAQDGGGDGPAAKEAEAAPSTNETVSAETAGDSSPAETDPDDSLPAPAGLADRHGITDDDTAPPAEQPSAEDVNPSSAGDTAGLQPTKSAADSDPAAEPPAVEPEADPFSGTDIPPAEVLEPVPDKKRPWWKLF